MKILHTPKTVAQFTLIPAALVWIAASAYGPNVQDNAQTHKDHKEHEGHAGMQESVPTLSEQLAELRVSVARLEAALELDHSGESNPGTPAAMDMGSGGMGSMESKDAGGAKDGMGMGGMTSMGAGKGKMSKPQMAGMAGMQASSAEPMSMGMKRMQRMGMMGRMGAASAPEPAAILSSLPGFPGASHIYHIGASGHFLDHADMIQLAAEQRKQLSLVQEQSMLAQAKYVRSTQQAEQELWVLTSAAEPDASAIETKVREVAGIEAEQRLAFIRSVGEAAEILTTKQRSVLVGDLAASFEATQSPSGSR